MKEKVNKAVDRIIYLMESISTQELTGSITAYNLCAAAITISPDIKSSNRQRSPIIVNSQLIIKQFEAGRIVIIPSINSDTPEYISLIQAAEEVAEATRVRKLIFLTDYDGICQVSKNLLRQAHPDEIEELINSKKITGTFAEISKAAIKAIKSGIRRVHIINGRKPYSLLLEVYSKDGVGTMIYQGHYREIRPARKSDIPGISALLDDYSQTGLVRKISQCDIQKKIGGFIVAVIDSQIIACGCVQEFPEEGKGFISSVAVGHTYVSDGVGSKILKALEDKARESDLKVLSLVSPKSGSWWMHQEFTQGSLEDLPKDLKTIYSNSVAPIFLIKNL